MINRKRKIKVTGHHNIGLIEGPVIIQYESSPEKLIKSFDQVMNLKEYEIDTLLDRPILKDIQDSEKSEIYADDITINQIETKLLVSGARRLLLRGAGGRGKTVLGRLFAHKVRKAQWEVYFIDIQELDESDIDGLTTELEKILNQKSPTLITFENAHSSDAVTSAFVRRTNYFFNHFTNSHFLFLSRDFALDEDIDPFRDWKRKDWYLSVTPYETTILKIVDQYLKSIQSNYQLSPKDLRWLNEHIIVYPSKYSPNVGGNLRLLRLYLNSWDNDEKELSQLTEHDIISELKKYVYSHELERDEELREQLGKVVSVFQFDVPFYAQSHSETDTNISLRLLNGLSHLVRHRGRYFYTLVHSVDAYYIGRCLASIHQEDSYEEFTAHRIIRYIRSIIGTIPSIRVSENIYTLFRNIGLFSPTGLDKHVLLNLIYNEAKELLFDICIQYSLNITYNLLLSITKNPKLGKGEAFNFWNILCERLDDKVLIEKIDASEIRAVALLTREILGYSIQQGLDFYRKYIKLPNVINSDITSFQLFLFELPNDEVTNIIKQMSPDQFVQKAITGATLTNFNWAIDRIEMTDVGPKFLMETFSLIEANYYSQYRELILGAKGYRPIENHINHLNKYNPALRKQIAKDSELVNHTNKLMYTRNKVIDGVRLIGRRFVKNFVAITVLESFFTSFNYNFTGDFRLDFDNMKLIKQLIRKIYKTTSVRKGTEIAEKGQLVISKIIRNLTDKQIKDICYDRQFLDYLEAINKSLLEYVGERCKGLY